MGFYCEEVVQCWEICGILMKILQVITLFLAVIALRVHIIYRVRGCPGTDLTCCDTGEIWGYFE